MEWPKIHSLYHYARLIELMYSVEKAVELLEDDTITGSDIKVGLNEPLMSIDDAKKSDVRMRGSWSYRST